MFNLAAMIASGLLLGLAWAAHQAHARVDDVLAPENVNEVSRVVMRIAGLPQRTDRGWRFEVDILEARPEGVPARVMVSWLAPGGAPGSRPLDQAELLRQVPEPFPGDIWRAALILRPPAGTRNPHLFDYEGLMFARGIRAQGTVRGSPRRLDDYPAPFSLAIAVEQVRYRLRALMRADLAQARYGPVMIALALGDQAGVDAADWQVFNGAGITHLVSISGSHVTLLAGMVAWVVMRLWRRLAWRGRGWAERWPAQQAGALVALVVAGLYCVLAGWGVPARRTFFMLAVTLSSMLLRLPLSASHVLGLAAVAVLVLDPWAVLSAGFWLSFAAVLVLMACVDEARTILPGAPPGSAMRRWWQRVKPALRQAVRLQWAVTLALMPALASMFQQLPLLSPLANALAIPVVGVLVTPLVVVSACVYAIPVLAGVAGWGLWLAHALFEAMMLPLQWLSSWSIGLLDVAAPPLAWLLLALVGAAWALRPAGWPLPLAGWLLMLPALSWAPARPVQGEWRVSAIDVGQGTAILVETASGATLFDTGMRYGPAADAGGRIVRPYLRAQGWNTLDQLVISHADADHAGGVASVLRAMPVRQAYSSFDLAAFLRREERLGYGVLAAENWPLQASICADGVTWQRDGVRFRFVHPPWRSGKQWWRGVNADSCVLKVEGAYHQALLTGDIGAEQERQLVAAGEVRADWLAAAHHGSATSSDANFVTASGARHVVAQLGAWNRYRHPHPTVVQRWRDAGAVFWRSDRDGAVVAYSRASGLDVWAERAHDRRYWQAQGEGNPEAVQ